MPELQVIALPATTSAHLDAVPVAVKTETVSVPTGDVETPSIEERSQPAPYAWRVDTYAGETWFMSKEHDVLVIRPFGPEPGAEFDPGEVMGERMKLDLVTGRTRYGGEPGAKRLVYSKELEAWQAAGILVTARAKKIGGAA